MSAFFSATAFAGAMIAVLAIATSAPHAVAAPAGGVFPQLIAEHFATGASLPAGVDEPKPSYDFVDQTKLPAGSKILSAAKARNGAVWVVTDRGVFRSGPGNRDFGKLILPLSQKPLQPPVAVDTEITCVASDHDGQILAGSNFGLFLTDGGNWWHIIDRRDGMPIEVLQCLYTAPNGDVWAGTDDGAWRMRSGRFRYFAGRRWLLDNHVTNIWGDASGRVWLKTSKGISSIQEKLITLGAKAKYFNDLTQKYNNRRGFINERTLKNPGTLEGSTFEVSDNDGLWNSIYVAAQAYRFAATHDEEAQKQGWESMHAMLELERVTGISGFPARAIITDEEIAAGNTGFSADETVRIDGETEKIWFRSPVQKNLWCKGDTSSDELDGHYYAWLTFFDLAATPEQKQQIAATCRRVTDNIVAGGFNLIGHTGRKTRWAVFGPQFINEDPKWADQRGLNSLELLGYLLIASHVTGDKKYDTIYENLIHEHHYLLNTLVWRTRAAAEWQNLNHSDDEMANMDYHNLLALEKNPDRRRVILQSFRNTWEDNGVLQSLKFEHSPWYNFTYGGLTGLACAPDEAIETLQDWPMDRIQWRMDNSRRADVVFKEGRGLHAKRELSRVLPMSERFLHRWNGNPFDAAGGSDGHGYDDGAAWLLGYWCGVYFGYLPVEK